MRGKIFTKETCSVEADRPLQPAWRQWPRMGADFAAPPLATFLEQHWAQGSEGAAPHNLKDTFSAWLAKPGEDASRPSGLRPMDCLASTLGTDWLRTGLTFYADDALAQWQITCALDLINAAC